MQDHLFFFLGGYQEDQDYYGYSSLDYQSSYETSSSASSTAYSEPEAPSPSSSSSSFQSYFSTSSSSLSAIISFPFLSLLSRYFSFLKVLKMTLLQSCSLEKGLSSQSIYSISVRPFSYLTESSLAILLSPKLNLTNFLQLAAMVFKDSSGKEFMDTSSSCKFLRTGKFYKEERSHSAIDRISSLLQASIAFLISGVILPIGISERSSSTISAGFPCFFILVLTSTNAALASAIPLTLEPTNRPTIYVDQHIDMPQPQLISIIPPSPIIMTLLTDMSFYPIIYKMIHIIYF